MVSYAEQNVAVRCLRYFTPGRQLHGPLLPTACVGAMRRNPVRLSVPCVERLLPHWSNQACRAFSCCRLVWLSKRPPLQIVCCCSRPTECLALASAHKG
jgi:hypothetical protein